jgi:hypothetical protein
MQNKPNFQKAKMVVTSVIATTNNDEQRTTNYQKQTQTKPIANLVLQNGHHEGKMFLY